MDTYLTQYQSHHLTDEEIKTNFIVRQEEFSEVINDIKNTEQGSSFKHFVFVGKRGSGKSTLLRRIEAEINTDSSLRSRYIVFNLGEEQSGIYRLHDLWDKVIQFLNTLDHNIVEPDFRTFDDIKDYAKKLHSEIIQCLQNKSIQLILLIDNIDRILKSVDDALLREQLMNHLDIRIIGGSTHMSEAFWAYDKPFYEFFSIRRLQALSTDEIALLLTHWGNTLDKPELKEYALKYTGRIQSIRILTDGMPRTMFLFVQMLVNREDQNGYEYLKRIVDTATPIYQERLGMLTPPQQKVLTELAFSWEASTVKDLVPKCKMESKLISSYMAQLIDLKYVKKIKGKKRNLFYRVEERFFNLWIIMTQGGPAERQEARHLSEFLELWYDKKQPKSVYQTFKNKLSSRELKMDNTLSMSRALINDRNIFFSDHKELYLSRGTTAKLAEFITGDANEYFLNLNRNIEMAYVQKEYQKALQLLEIYDSTDGSKEFGLGLVYDQLGRTEKSRKFYEKAVELGQDQALNNLANIKLELGDFKEAEELYKRARKLGHKKAIFNLAKLKEDQGNLHQAEKYYSEAITSGDDKAFFELACLKHVQGDFKAAEGLYMKAINNGDIVALNNILVMFLEGNRKDSMSSILDLVPNHIHKIDIELRCIVQLSVGQMKEYEYLLSEILNHPADISRDFLLWLIKLGQTKTIDEIFTAYPILKEKYVLIHYAFKILNEKNEIIRLTIPPELIETVDSIVTDVRNYHQNLS